MSVKEVKVELTDADIRAESRQTRKRRTRKTGGAEELTGVTVPSPTPATSASGTLTTSATPATAEVPVATVVSTTTATLTTVPALPTPTTTLSSSSPPASTTPTTSSTSSTTGTGVGTDGSSTLPAVGGASRSGVLFKTRKRSGGGPIPPTPLPSRFGAKIIPTKRHAPVTRDRPKLRIPTVAPTAPAVPVTHASLPTQTSRIPKKRRFTERRIGISMKSLKTTRKANKSIRKQVAAMSVPALRATLLEKGVIQPKSNPPEPMLRSLMKEYLSLKH